jgi:hypothetical protein
MTGVSLRGPSLFHTVKQKTHREADGNTQANAKRNTLENDTEACSDG